MKSKKFSASAFKLTSNVRSHAGSTLKESPVLAGASVPSMSDAFPVQPACHCPVWFRISRVRALKLGLMDDLLTPCVRPIHTGSAQVPEVALNG